MTYKVLCPKDNRKSMYHLILENIFVSLLVFQERNSYMFVSVGQCAPRYNIIIPDSKQ